MNKLFRIAIFLGIPALAVLIPLFIGGTDAAKAAILILGILGMLAVIISPAFFVVIPRNHAVCVTIDGRFSHYMMSLEDKQKVLDALNVATLKLPSNHTLILNPFDGDSIVCREEHLFWGMFVSLFNAHFKSWNIFSSSLKEVSIKRTKVNPGYKKVGKVASYVILSDEEDGTTKTPFLRLEFPRLGTAMDIELGDNTGVNLAYSVSGLLVFDLYNAFFVRSAEFSTMIDEAIETAFGAFLKKIDFAQYMKENFGTNPNTPLNIFMREESTSTDPEDSSGISHIGVLITGTVSVPAREAAEGSEDMVKAKIRQSVATANASALQTETEAEATALEIKTKAKAAAIVTTGAAEAEAEANTIAETGRAQAASQKLLFSAEVARAKSLATSLGKEGAAEVLRAEKLQDASTVVIGGNTPITLPIGGGNSGGNGNKGNKGKGNKNGKSSGQSQQGGPPPPPPAPNPKPNPPPNPPAAPQVQPPNPPAPPQPGPPPTPPQNPPANP